MGMTGKEIVETQKKYYLQSWAKQKDVNPIPMEKAEGIYLWDYDGNRYTDMSSTQVNVNLGYGNEDINNAMKEQINKFAWMGPGYGVESRAKLAKMIVDLMPDNMGKIFFTNGGADANENAIKMARMYTGRYKVMSRYRSYHGSTFGAGNLTGEPRRFPLEPGIPGFVKFFDPYLYRESIRFESEEAATEFYIAKLREQIIYEGRDQIAAIILETVTGTNGIIIPPKGYLQGVRKLCDEFGIVMICDEVMAGFYRTGKMFAFMNFDMKPDIITFAKGVTCGYVQLGGCIVSKKVAEYFEKNVLQCGLTYSGHTLACAAGVAAMKYYKEHDIEGHVAEMHEIVAPFMDEMVKKHKCIGEARCIGLFGALEVVKNKETREPMQEYGVPGPVMPWIFAELKKRGFATFGRENFIEICPPLIITKEELEEYLPILDEVLTMVDEKFCD